MCVHWIEVVFSFFARFKQKNLGNDHQNKEYMLLLTVPKIIIWSWHSQLTWKNQLLRDTGENDTAPSWYHVSAAPIPVDGVDQAPLLNGRLPMLCCPTLRRAGTKKPLINNSSKSEIYWNDLKQRVCIVKTESSTWHVHMRNVLCSGYVGSDLPRGAAVLSALWFFFTIVFVTFSMDQIWTVGLKNRAPV